MTLRDDMTETILGAIVDHPMWIGDDGKPLDYLPQREALIGDAVREASHAALAVVVEWLRTELAVLHGRAHWCAVDGRPDFCSPDGKSGFPWPCDTLKVLGRAARHNEGETSPDSPNN